MFGRGGTGEGRKNKKVVSLICENWIRGAIKMNCRVYHMDGGWSYTIECEGRTISMWRGLGLAEMDGFKYPICKVRVKEL